MRSLRFFILSVICHVAVDSLLAQPVFYSQYYRAQMMLNPALTGMSPEKWRITGLLQQKAFDTTLTHSTKMIFAEYRFQLNNKYKGYGLVVEDNTPLSFGIGLGSEWRNSPYAWHQFVSAYGSLALHYRPGKQTVISIGVQPGVFEGAGYYPVTSALYNTSPDSMVLPGRPYRLHFDYNAGILFGAGLMDCWKEDQLYRLMIGAGIYHMKREYRLPAGDQLPGKEIHAHASYLIEVNNRIGIIPRVLYMYEGESNYQAGAAFLYRRHWGNFDRLRVGLAYKSGQYLAASGGFRIYGGNDKTLSADIEVSYDFALKDQTNTGLYHRAFEISLIISPLKKCWSQSECSGTYQLESF